jgi:hypothetical protein
MLAAARTAWRMQRWELLVLVGGSLLVALAMVVVAWQVDANAEALAACYERPATTLSAECRSAIGFGNFLGSAVGVLGGVGIVVPFGVGILLGGPMVAREVERRTAPIAWSLSRSRRRWLAGRVLPVALAVALALAAVGAASELLLRVTRDAEPGFMDFGAHGPLIAARGLGALGIGVLVGLVCGRVLPAILVTGLATIALMAGLQLARDQMMRAEAVWIEVPEDGGSFAMVYDQAWTDDATGALVTYDEAFARHPEAFGPEGSWMPPGMTQVYLATPADLYPNFVAREIAALALLAAVAGASAAWVIGWRRPE